MANIAHYSGQEMRLKENPLVSVVIPMFNAEDWIVGLMHSILNQSYKNIEVILLNDGSTDASVELVSKAAQEFGQNRVRIITSSVNILSGPSKKSTSKRNFSKCKI